MTSMDVGWFRTLRLRWPQFEIMLLNCVAVTIALYGEILFDKFGTDQWQLTGIILETRRVVLIEMLLQRQDLFLHPVTSMYYIAPCRWNKKPQLRLMASAGFYNRFWTYLSDGSVFIMCSLVCLFIPWCFLERPAMLASTFWNQSSFWAFLTTNAAFALVLNFVSLLMIQRTSALRYWVALVVKDWMLVALLPKKTIFDKVSYTIGNNTSLHCG